MLRTRPRTTGTYARFLRDLLASLRLAWMFLWLGNCLLILFGRRGHRPWHSSKHFSARDRPSLSPMRDTLMAEIHSKDHMSGSARIGADVAVP